MEKHEFVTKAAEEIKDTKLSLEDKIQTVYRILNRVSEDGEITEIIVSDMLNGFGNEKMNDFVNALMKDHRTLQQSFMRLMIGIINAWNKTEYYDERNEATIKLANKLSEAIKDVYMPLV